MNFCTCSHETFKLFCHTVFMKHQLLISFIPIIFSSFFINVNTGRGNISLSHCFPYTCFFTVKCHNCTICCPQVNTNIISHVLQPPLCKINYLATKNTFPLRRTLLVPFSLMIGSSMTPT